jgi:hypothetical protein
MNEATQGFIVSNEIAASIVSSFEMRCRGHARSEQDVDSYVGYLPTAALVQQLIGIAFWAGQTQEEGRISPVRLILADADSQTCIINKVDLSTENLRKLSPFLDDEDSWLYVNQEKKIVGVGRYPLGALAIQIDRYRNLAVSVETKYDRDVLALMESGSWCRVGKGQS